MPSWGELVAEFDQRAQRETENEQQPGLHDISVRNPMGWLTGSLTAQLAQVKALRDDRNVLFYASGFLQKPGAGAPSTSITHEDVNGLMSVIYGMDYDNGLTLILHTPGGVTTAAESFVAYMRAKFPDVEVIVPTFAFSAGTMIATGCDRIWMGRQSQLGPIDPQMPMPSTGRFVSAQAIVAQFEKATMDIKADSDTALAYAPILQTMGPALVQEARVSLRYSEDTVARWMTNHMFQGDADAEAKAKDAAHFLNDRDTHLDHSRRIDRDEARRTGLVVFDLEASQDLQEAVLTAYHLMTILFERTPSSKVMYTHLGQTWLKNWAPTQ
jgi:ClpP class serine protease